MPAETDTVICRSEMTHGRDKRSCQVFGAEEFIAAVNQHIPPKGYQTLRHYYGWYSNRARQTQETQDAAARRRTRSVALGRRHGAQRLRVRPAAGHLQDLAPAHPQGVGAGPPRLEEPRQTFPTT
jgi:hypothetical protein